MNAIDLLKTQHREIEDLFSQFDDASSLQQRAAVVTQIADNFAAHALIEERIFYPAAYAGKTADMLSEAVEEHLAAKRIVADLLDMTPSDENFAAKVKVLKEQIEHHVQEEEEELFPTTRTAITTTALDELGAQMASLFVETMEHDPRTAIPGEIAEAAPVH